MVAAFIHMRLRLHQLSLIAPVLCFAACGSVAVTPDGGGGSTGSAGSGGGSTGSAGSSAGTTGSAGSSAGTTGSAGSSAGGTGVAGVGGRGGTTGTAGAGGRGGTTGVAGVGGRGGTTGTAGAGGGPGTGGRGGVGGVGGGCVLGGVTYPPGPVPSSDNCNTCTCTAGGQIACTLRVCTDAGAPGTCNLDATYRYGDTGGHTAWEDQVTLTPPAGYRYVRSPRATDPINLSCAPPLPTCGLANAIDGGDIMRVILDADVQAALSKPADPAMPLIFGRDNRPVDSPIFRFSRGDGREFFVGGPCPRPARPPAAKTSRPASRGWRRSCARSTSSSSPTRAAQRCAEASFPTRRQARAATAPRPAAPGA